MLALPSYFRQLALQRGHTEAQQTRKAASRISRKPLDLSVDASGAYRVGIDVNLRTAPARGGTDATFTEQQEKEQAAE